MIEELLIIGEPRDPADSLWNLDHVTRRIIHLPHLKSPPAADCQPDLVLVHQHWPDEFTSEEIHSLIAKFPLARFIVSLGDWCASYGRTRAIWPAAVCVPHHEAPARLQREIEVLAGQRGPLPLTAGLDEIFAFDHDLGMK